MFSRDDVANFINRNFEPVWQSVRPVPIVRIDFGNGTVLTRTLHGNIATYVCSPDGQVLDLLAGIYEPATYLQRLNQLRLLANFVDQQGVAKRAERLRDYHKGQLEALKKNGPAPVFVNLADRSKARIEGGVKAMLVKGRAAPAVPVKGGPDPALRTPQDKVLWAALAEDTRANESVRRRQVHELLAASGPVAPEKITRRIYKDILHADLDDPYLGLGDTLFANYPFKDDKATR